MDSIKVLVQSIDLSKLPFLRKEDGFRVVDFHGIDIHYLDNDPESFAIKRLFMTLGYDSSFRVKQNMFFDHHYYKRVFVEEKITLDNSYKTVRIKGRQNGFFSTRVLWFSIHWLLPNLFIEKICEVYGHFDIYNNEIRTTDLYDYSAELTKSSYLGLTTSKFRSDHFIALRDAAKSMKSKYGSGYDVSKASANSKTLPDRIVAFKARSAWKDLTMEEIRNNAGVPATFTHPNLAVYYLDKLNFLEFWNTFIEYFEKENELRAIDETQGRRYVFNLNNSLVEDIDDIVGLAKLGDMIVKIHKDTAFIHVATSAKIINETKYSHLDRWFKSSDTIEYIEELETEIRNGEVVTCEYKTSKSEELETVAKLATTCNSKNSEDLGCDLNLATTCNSKNSDTTPISEQLKEHPSYFRLGSEYSVEERGYFFHPELFMYYLIYLDKKIAVKYIHMIFSVLVGISTSGVSEKEFIERCNEFAQRKIMQLQSNIINLEEENEKQRAEINRFEVANSGSIMLIDGPEGLQLRKSPYNEPERPGRKVINGVKFYDKVYKLMREKMNKEFTKLKNGKYNTTLEESASIIDDIVADAKAELVEPSNDEFKWNEELYNKRKKLYDETGDAKVRGFLYESYCSKVLSAYVHEDLPEWFKTKFGLNDTDGGIDLFDLNNKILYQCKYYKTLKMSMALKRTNEAISAKIQACDKDFIIRLVIPSSCSILKDVKEMFGANNIIRIDMNGDPIPINIDKHLPPKTVIEKKLTLKERQQIFIRECKEKYDAEIFKDNYLCHDNTIYYCRDLKTLQINPPLLQVHETFESLKDDYDCKIVVRSNCDIHSDVKKLFGKENILFLDEKNEISDFVKHAAEKLNLNINNDLYELIDQENKILYKCSTCKRVKLTMELAKAAICDDYVVKLIVPNSSYVDPSVRNSFDDVIAISSC